jgi:hypothetical protein
MSMNIYIYSSMFGILIMRLVIPVVFYEITNVECM